MIWDFSRDEIILSREDVRVSKYQEIKFSTELFRSLDLFFAYNNNYYYEDWKEAINAFLNGKSLVTDFNEDSYYPYEFLEDYEIDELIDRHSERIKNVE